VKVHPHLTLIGTTHYFRRAVPRALRATVGKTILIRSLRTADEELAILRGRTWSLLSGRLFSSLMTMIRYDFPSSVMRALHKEIDGIIADWPYFNLMGAKPDVYDEDFAQDVFLTVQEDHQANLRKLNDRESCLNEGEAFLKKHGLPQNLSVERKTQIGKFAIRIAAERNSYAAQRIATDVLPPPDDCLPDNSPNERGKIADPELVALRQQDMATAVPTPAISRQSAPASSGPSLQALIDEFKGDNPALFATKRRYDFLSAFDLLGELVGLETSISGIDKQVMRTIKDVLLNLPVHARKYDTFKGMTYPEIAKACADRDDITRMTNRRRNTLIECIRQLLDHARKQGYIEDNPANEMSFAEKGESEKRVPFTDEQLQRIFNAPVYRGCKSDHKWLEPGDLIIKDSAYWMPLLALYTGARAEELLQLTGKQVRMVGDIPVISIEGRLKTDNAKRLVPLHPDLVKFGFVEWAGAVKQDERLFPDIQLTPADQKFSTQFSKRFRRFLDSLGFERGGPVFHSFRHTFIDKMRAVEGVDESVIAALVGHANRSITSRYGSGYPVDRLYGHLKNMIIAIDIAQQ
jgi:integrase